VSTVRRLRATDAPGREIDGLPAKVKAGCYVPPYAGWFVEKLGRLAPPETALESRDV
jgi:hypothetical protein